MKKAIKYKLLLGVLCLFCSCQDEFICERGIGPVREKEVSIAEFTGIRVEDGIKVYLRQGAEQSVKVEGQTNVIDVLNKKVENKTWKINYRHCVRRSEDLKIFITIPLIKSIKVTGSGEVIIEESLTAPGGLDLDVTGSGKITGAVNTTDLASDITGSGEIDVNGTADFSHVQISGSGNFFGFDLIASKCKVEIAGSGDAEVFAERQLDVKITGSGDVKYKGNPSVNSKITGSGKIRKID